MSPSACPQVTSDADGADAISTVRKDTQNVPMDSDILLRAHARWWVDVDQRAAGGPGLEITAGIRTCLLGRGQCLDNQ